MFASRDERAVVVWTLGGGSDGDESDDDNEAPKDAPALSERRRFTVGAPPTALAFSPNGNTLVVGGRDGSLRAWDAETGASPGDAAPLPAWARMRRSRC
jgi:WD40 repeat protein